MSNNYTTIKKKLGRPIRAEIKATREAGEEFYFTGIPCQHGHVAKRYVKNHYCVECEATIYKELDRNLNRKYNVSKYGITEEQYQEMLKAQNGLCLICLQPETILDKRVNGPKRLSIDHCHKTKKIRGLLCRNCNIGIGNLKHNSEALRRAALYCEEE